MKETNEISLTLSVNFDCLFAKSFEVNVELENANRVHGLQQAWTKAFENYCPNEISKMQKQLKRKLGSIFNFHDLSDVVIRFTNAEGKREEIRLTTNYPMVG